MERLAGGRDRGLAHSEVIVAGRMAQGPCVSPLRGAGLLRCASSRCQRPSVSPLRAAIPHAGSPPPSALAGAQGVAGLRPAALPVRSPMQRSRLRLHRDAEQPESGRRCRRGMTTAARSRARGSRALDSFTLRVNDGPLDELTGAALTALRFVRCAPARSSPRSPATPEAGPLNADRSVRPGSTAAPVAALWWHVGRGAAGPRNVGGRLRCNRCARQAVTSAAMLRAL